MEKHSHDPFLHKMIKRHTLLLIYIALVLSTLVFLLVWRELL